MNTAQSMTVLTNSFHGTTYRTRKTREEMDAIEGRLWTGTADDADKAYVRRVRNALCGISDCKCAMSSFGER